MSEKAITWPQLSNWMPLIMSAVSIALTFATLDRRLALVEQKLDNLISISQDMSGKYSNVEEKYGNLSIRVNTLETRLNNK